MLSCRDSILTYQVVSDKVMAADVVEMTSATTVNEQQAALRVVNGKVLIYGAQFVKTDIESGNGVII